MHKRPTRASGARSIAPLLFFLSALAACSTSGAGPEEDTTSVETATSSAAHVAPASNAAPNAHGNSADLEPVNRDAENLNAENLNAEDLSLSPESAASSTNPMTESKDQNPEEAVTESTGPNGYELATLGAGCYWCIEAILEKIDGIQAVESGFMGGEVANPTYSAVTTGTTGHAEVVNVIFDPDVISYSEVLDWFWRLHDPTTLNRQGADVGTQYRSAIFTHSEAQAKAAELSKRDVQPSFEDPIVTEIAPASTFYTAPEYHQGYYEANPRSGYCRAVILPKLKKLGLQQ